jgi:hypothetical protein
VQIKNAARNASRSSAPLFLFSAFQRPYRHLRRRSLPRSHAISGRRRRQQGLLGIREEGERDEDVEGAVTGDGRAACDTARGGRRRVKEGGKCGSPDGASTVERKTERRREKQTDGMTFAGFAAPSSSLPESLCLLSITCDLGRRWRRRSNRPLNIGESQKEETRKTTNRPAVRSPFVPSTSTLPSRRRAVPRSSSPALPCSPSHFPGLLPSRKKRRARLERRLADLFRERAQDAAPLLRRRLPSPERPLATSRPAVPFPSPLPRFSSDRLTSSPDLHFSLLSLSPSLSVRRATQHGSLSTRHSPPLVRREATRQLHPRARHRAVPPYLPPTQGSDRGSLVVGR